MAKRWRDKNYLTKHHIVGQKCREWANVEDETNIYLLRVLEHQALNTLFKDKQCPHEQLEVMYEIRENILSDYAKELIETLLSLPREKFYKSYLIKWQKKRR